MHERYLSLGPAERQKLKESNTARMARMSPDERDAALAYYRTHSKARRRRLKTEQPELLEAAYQRDKERQAELAKDPQWRAKKLARNRELAAERERSKMLADVQKLIGGSNDV